MKGTVKEGVVCGRISWAGLTLPYLMFLRASELIAEDGGRVHFV